MIGYMGLRNSFAGFIILHQFFSVHNAIVSHDVLWPLHISRVHLIHSEHVYIREAERNIGKGKKNTRITKRREKGKLILTCHSYQHNGNTDSLGKQNLLFSCF